MKTLNIEALQNEIVDFARQRDWEQFHTPKNLACALSVEASELLEIFQWRKTEETRRELDSSTIDHIEEEVADIAVYLFRLCQLLEIDLEEAIKAKMVKNDLKYPVEKAKGNSKKYNKL